MESFTLNSFNGYVPDRVEANFCNSIDIVNSVSDAFKQALQNEVPGYLSHIAKQYWQWLGDNVDSRAFEDLIAVLVNDFGYDSDSVRQNTVDYEFLNLHTSRGFISFVSIFIDSGEEQKSFAESFF